MPPRRRLCGPVVSDHLFRILLQSTDAVVFRTWLLHNGPGSNPLKQLDTWPVALLLGVAGSANPNLDMSHSFDIQRITDSRDQLIRAI